MGIVDGSNVIEARGSVGVVITPIHEFMHRYTRTELRSLAGDVEKAKSLIGKPFDIAGLWGLFFMFPELHCKDAWFCSEIVALAADCFDDDKAFNVTPADVYRNSSAVW